ncbi:osmoprotectant ABC transporter substrate-binding protein [Alkalicoccobacillus murimartini]|uniref:Osmoprotectant transport system substrate-binding protein n=1 Tax=Alkalicoccobacillus murimartini TaxID=171685 RepID=A0ABT9YD27_9BACI|nr:osmoprotectant ABC transporter substrate-binding protein [Alkalicoccobacillus murimartini]MDQ0205762.1 osmoprotectant transport system substrate-binding protein [Alkalicoccobacillus murimartini]
MKTRAAMVLSLTGIVVLSGCSLPGLSGPSGETVKIGSLNTTESMIIGNMVKDLIEENTDLQVEMINNLGSSIVMHQAMMNGDVDIAATRYTGTDIAGALNLEPVMDPDEALDVVQTEFTERYDQTWFDSYGFANSYAITVTQELAEQEGLETISDLEDLAGELRVGVDTSWINRAGDGYGGFQETYFGFDNIAPMQIGLVYDALASDRMDAVLAYTTDGRIAAYDLKVLEDDQQFFPPYDTSLVADNQLLRDHPELESVLNRLVDKIDTETMQELNYESDGLMKEPAIVASEFLEEHDFFNEEVE